ncbi:MAG TPA: alpha/beta hydrolase [Acidimicrobiales bacterium]|nr:alpha/beta hydrolase [Acidimicrobiales bacterium]
MQLTLDVYEPAGDTAAKRPAVVWMHGGWFSEGDKADMAGYAEAFARRGYVAVSMEYRMRPELECCPTRDAVGITEALLDGHEDAMAGLEWLHEHAAEHRIDPEAIAAGGDGAGAANSLGLAFPPGHAEHPGTGHGMVQQAAMEAAEEPLIAAALPISGVSLGAPGEGAPPVLAFHGSEDNTAPAHLTESNCAAAEAAGSRCDVVSYAGAFGDIAVTRQRDIVRRSADFLAEVVLEPLGYFQEPPEQPTTTTAPAGSGGTTTTTHTSPAAAKGGGGLPRTGSDAWPLVWLGLGLVGFGAAAIVARRLVVRHRGTFGAAVVIMVVLGGLVVPHNTAAAEDPPTGGSTTTTTSPTTSTTEATSTTVAAPAPEDPPPDDPDVTEPEPAVPAPADPPPEDTAPDDDAEDPMPEDPGHEDPGHDDPPAHEFPEEWTPEQVAYATQLIADTEMSLERYANPAILGLLGYTWITDGRDPGGYQHWVNLGWILDGHTLDPEFPESLVLRNTGDGLMVEAAMFILDRYGMENIPDDIAWLPGWHVHDNICWDGSRLVGIAVDGECERGFLLVTPPMVHVWIVDTPCGRFVGIDEHGLMCDHEHEG